MKRSKTARMSIGQRKTGETPEAPKKPQNLKKRVSEENGVRRELEFPDEIDLLKHQLAQAESAAAKFHAQSLQSADIYYQMQKDCSKLQAKLDNLKFENGELYDHITVIEGEKLQLAERVKIVEEWHDQQLHFKAAGDECTKTLQKLVRDLTEQNQELTRQNFRLSEDAKNAKDFREIMLREARRETEQWKDQCDKKEAACDRDLRIMEVQLEQSSAKISELTHSVKQEKSYSKALKVTIRTLQLQLQEKRGDDEEVPTIVDSSE